MHRPRLEASALLFIDADRIQTANIDRLYETRRVSPVYIILIFLIEIIYNCERHTRNVLRRENPLTEINVRAFRDRSRENNCAGTNVDELQTCIIDDVLMAVPRTRAFTSPFDASATEIAIGRRGGGER